MADTEPNLHNKMKILMANTEPNIELFLLRSSQCALMKTDNNLIITLFRWPYRRDQTDNSKKKIIIMFSHPNDLSEFKT